MQTVNYVIYGNNTIRTKETSWKTKRTTWEERIKQVAVSRGMTINHLGRLAIYPMEFKKWVRGKSLTPRSWYNMEEEEEEEEEE